MKKITLFVLLGILAVGLESCSLFNSKGGEDTNSTQPANTKTSTNANNSQPQAESENPDNQATSEGEEELAESEGRVEISGLIPATDADVRVSGSIRGRQDPFALVALKPEIIVEESEDSELEANYQNNSSPSNSNLDTPSNIESTPTIDSLENPVETETMLAQNVVISGLIELGDSTKIIVQAPGEKTSRYVSVGEYISEGKILVKGLNLDNYRTPSVVLEQNGTEITKAIGEQPTAASQEEGSISWVSNYLSQQ